jgi:hypothetical protein
MHDQARAVGKGPWLSPLSFLLWVAVSRKAFRLFCLLLVQSLAERVPARTGLLWEAANVHVAVVAAREAKLQSQVESVQEIQCVKEVMARKA